MSAKPRWSLTPLALERLLERLGPDAESAGRAYQALRARLVDYFDWKGAAHPETAADEALDRVARRLEEGQAIERVEAYVHGVARLVMHEQVRLQLRERRANAGAALALTGDPPGSEETRVACLARCLQGLAPEERALIIGYYEGTGRTHLDGRRALAARLGIGYPTLKTRAHRLRLRLDACLRRCLGPDGSQP